MSWKNRVIWSEGLFLKPQHFQQHDRYVESYVEGRCRGLHNNSWGFNELVLDLDQLAIGKIALSRAKGVFSDGTPFDIPDVDRPPPPIDIDESIRESRVHLALPIRRNGEAEISGSEEEEGLSRYVAREISASDVSDYGQGSTEMRVGTLRTRLLLDTDQREDFACLGVTHVVEAKADRSVKVDANYVPPIMDVQVASFLSGFANELQGLLHHRADELASRVTASGKDGAAGIAEFLQLQTLNRYEPVVAHLATLPGLHPEELYRELLEIAGDLGTFDDAKRVREFPQYNHDELAQCFEPVMNSLRDSLGLGIISPAVRIPLKDPRHGIRAGLIQDPTLLSTANFVLAVRADMPMEDLRNSFPPQAKVGSVNNIRQLIQAGIPGIPLNPMAAAPPQIPFYSDFVYFSISQPSEHWPVQGEATGFAIWLGSEIPGLDMQFWAIRR